MSCEKTAIPDDLLQLSQRLEEWRSAHPPRSRLSPETGRALGPPRPAPPAFLEVLATTPTGVAEWVVELESTHGRVRVAMKGMALDWAGLLHAWREADA